MPEPVRSRLKKYIERFQDKHVAVIGAGISNMPLIDVLLKAGIKVTIRDKRSIRQLGSTVYSFCDMGAVLKTGDEYLDDLCEDVIFRTPGLMPWIPQLQDAIQYGTILTSEMEAFFDICPCKTIGITGSDGKTTTTAIIAELLKSHGYTVHVGGNIGKPLLCSVDDMDENDFAVVELSSFQLITMNKSPDTAVITNLTPNHLDIHSSLEEYIQAKRNIFLFQKPGNRAVFNYDDDVTRGFAGTASDSEVLFFSMHERIHDGVYLDDEGIIRVGSTGHHDNKDKLYRPADDKIIDASEILLPGSHNTANYLAAFSALKDIVSFDTMRKIAKGFEGVAHRLELIRELCGVRYYNDSIASSPTRTIAGLRSFGQKVILIAGGKDKGIAFDELGSEINKKVKKLILTGAAANQIKEAVINAPEYDGKLEILHFDDFTDAVKKASMSARCGDIVLLSPACTSFDRFNNFEERGNLFKVIVGNLGGPL